MTEPDTTTDIELIARIRAGNADAYGALMLRMRAYAEYQLSVVPAHDREEILARVFENVHRKLDAFDPAKASFPTWINAIARNALRDHWRAWYTEKNNTALARVSDGELHAEVFRKELEDAFLSDVKEQIFAVIGKVENGLLKEYLVAKYRFLLTDKVLAEVFEVDGATVRSNMRRANNLFFLKFSEQVTDGRDVDLRALARALKDGALYAPVVSPRVERDPVRSAVVKYIFHDGRSVAATAELNAVSTAEVIEQARNILMDSLVPAKPLFRTVKKTGMLREQPLEYIPDPLDRPLCDQKAVARLLYAAFSSLPL